MIKPDRLKPALVLIALVLTAAVSHYLTVGQLGAQDDAPVAAAEKKPLYWVAPMDPDYRRDRPGKSPMGMDLIPVYEQPAQGLEEGTGTVLISPRVVNNLGVRTVSAKRRRLHPQIDSVAYVQYDEDRLVHIHPRVEGWIEKLFVKAAGEPVVKGAPLYSLYSPQLVNAQEELLLALNRDNPRLVRAAEDRLRALQIDAAAIARLKRNRRVQQTMTFFAPQSGVVENLNIREGFFVKPGTTVMSVGNLSEVWVEAQVFERQAAQLKPDLPVTMTLDYLPGRQWRGKVDYVYPVLDPKTRTLRVRVRFENQQGLLKPNMFARLTIQGDDGVDVLAIPRDAVIRTGKQSRVVLAGGEGRFKSVAVSLGRSDEQYFEVTRGLEAGDRVVVSAQFLLDSESSKRSDFKRMESAKEEASTDAMPRHGNPPTDHGEMDHGAMDHGAMDHGAMDHGAMDHGAMNHGAMDHGAMDHGAMDHGAMDHGAMDHGAMDHGAMDHGAMDHGAMDHGAVDHGAMDHGAMDHGDAEHHSKTRDATGHSAQQRDGN
jgi:Cu(I)/Ag(I) efflux system membrane fusion protein